MANINLYQTDQTSFQRRSSGILGNGMAIGAVFALLTLMAYGGVEFYLRSLDQKMTELNERETEGRNALDEKKVNFAASFQQRLDKIKAGTDDFEPADPAKIFANIQSKIISGAVASKLEFKQKKVAVSLIVENFEVLSRQILSFKGSDFFQGVEVGATSRNEDGKITAVLILGTGN